MESGALTSINPSLGEFVRHRRHALGLTLVGLSQRCGLDHSYLSRIENGIHENPTVRALQDLADGLQVKVETLDRLARGLPVEAKDADPGDMADMVAQAPPEVQNAIKQILELTPDQQAAALPSLKATLELLRQKRR